MQIYRCFRIFSKRLAKKSLDLGQSGLMVLRTPSLCPRLPVSPAFHQMVQEYDRLHPERVQERCIELIIRLYLQ